MSRPLLLVGLVLALFLSACSDPDPEAQLAGAVDRTLDGSFTYEVSLEAEDEGGPGGQAGALLRGLLVSGSRDGDAWSLGVTVLGFDVFDLRVEDPDRRHVRLGLGEALAMFGDAPEGEFSRQVAAELSSRGEDDETVELARSAIDGEWITVEGPLSGEDIARALGEAAEGEGSDPAAVARVLGQDVREFVDRYVTVLERQERDDRVVYDVEVDTAALADALTEADPEGSEELEDIDDRYPGTVVVRDGLVHEIELRIGDGTRGGSGPTSQILLRATLDEHGEVPDVEQPDAAEVVDAERFLDALRALSELFAESPPAPR